MSAQEKFPTTTPWADRLFERFIRMFGAQKVASMWAGATAEEVAMEWEPQLHRFAPATLQSALQALIDSGKEWPPTLPEFVGMCREYNRPEAVGMLALGAPASRALGAEEMKVVQEVVAPILKAKTDYMLWAKYPKSEHAVRLLVRGCERNDSLKPILNKLLRTDGADCQTEEARTELLRVKAHLAQVQA